MERYTLWLGHISFLDKRYARRNRCRNCRRSRAPYEQTYLRRYAERFGDPEGVAARVEANLLDLLTVTRDSLVLPLPSFSLKVVEDYVGFERIETQYGGAWARATFIEATETSDEGKRKELMDKIVAYNKEDLEATWTVFQWLKARVSTQ